MLLLEGVESRRSRRETQRDPVKRGAHERFVDRRRRGVALRERAFAVEIGGLGEARDLGRRELWLILRDDRLFRRRRDDRRNRAGRRNVDLDARRRRFGQRQRRNGLVRPVGDQAGPERADEADAHRDDDKRRGGG